MSVAGGWLLGPLVLALLCTGTGVLLAGLVRTRVPGPLVPGLGLAGLIVIASVFTIRDDTAELAPWACLLAALAGLLLTARQKGQAPASTGRATAPSGGHPARQKGQALLSCAVWPVGAAVVAFGLMAAPPVLSGQASVAGYIKLDDSAIWLGLIAHVMEHGRDISMVPPSTFELDLKSWLALGYPVGTFVPVGVTAKLSGQDYANVYQPVIATYVAILALGLYHVVGAFVRRRWAAALAAMIGVQASLFYGYVQWGAVKEVCLAALLPVLVGLAVRGGWRALLLAGVVAGAILDGFGIGGIVWAGGGLLAGVAVGLLRRDRFVGLVAGAASGAAVMAATAVPIWVVIKRNAHEATDGAPVMQQELGKLVAPLDPLQGFGLWPAGDFRYPVDPRWTAVLLALLGFGLAAVAVLVALHRRVWALPALVAVSGIAALLVVKVGAPWIDAKVMAVNAPMLLAASAAAVLCARRRALVAAAAVAGSVLLAGAIASTWLAARDVYIAPRDELAELRGLGDQLAGKGPTLVLNYEGFGTRYFLGPAQDEGISDLRYNQIPNRSGEVFPNFSTAEIDDVDQRALFSYPAIVRRRTPVGSRPPSGYRSVHAGRYFEAWTRAGTLPTEHVSLGTPLQPAAQLECRRARAAAKGARTLVAAPAVNPVVVDLFNAAPAAWRTSDSLVRPATDDRAVVPLQVPRAGRWRVWVGGGTLGRLSVSVDGRSAGSYTHQLDASVGWLRFGARDLSAGRHTVTLRYARGWRPGRGDAGGQLPLGPVALAFENQPPLERLPARQVDRLCDGQDYDWIEAFG